MRNEILLLLVSFVAAAACGPAEEAKNNGAIVVIGENNEEGSNNGGGTNNGGTTNNATTDPDQQNLSARNQAIYDGYNAPADAKNVAGAGLDLTLEAVVAASLAANGGDALVATGTLTQAGQQFTYDAGPADRLVIKWAEGAATNLYVRQLDGNFEAQSAEEFFTDGHVVRVRVQRDGFADFEVYSALSNGAHEGAIHGTIVEAGVEYTLNLLEQGWSKSEAEFDVASRESERVMTGTISAPARGIELTVEETYRFKFQLVDNAVEQSTRTANSRWTFEGKTYALNNFVLQSAFRNGYPSEEDYWMIAGTITEDGTPVGQVTYENDELALTIYLTFANGERIMLQQHLKYQTMN